MARLTSRVGSALLLALVLFHPLSPSAQKAYGPGVTDTEILVGNTMPYSGPLSAYSTIGKVEAAYFRMINARGGINGRKIKFVTLDDGFNPAKTVEMTRKLVEQDEVLAIFNPLGTPTSLATRKYMNQKKVPQLFIASGASTWNEPANYAWTMGWQPNYQSEAQIYARHILQTRPNAKIAVLYQNDDSGRDYLKGLRDGLGARAGAMIVKALSYEVTDPTVDSSIVELKDSGADVFFNETSPKFAAQAIRKAYDIGWKPVQYLVNISVSIGAVLKPAGLEKSVGLISSAYLKDVIDPQWDNDPGMLAWRAFMKSHYPEGDLLDAGNLYGYAVAETFVQVLRQCGDNLTRENVMKQAANLKSLRVEVLLPGILIDTGPADFAPIESLQLMRFNGTQWVISGPIIGK